MGAFCLPVTLDPLVCEGGICSLPPVQPPPLPPDAVLHTWMDRLLRRAARVGEGGEIPVAAVLLDGRGRAIGWGSNRRERASDPLGHAELIALRQAAASRGDWRFNDCTLLVTLEPCPMCAGALIQARVGRVVFAARDSKRGALGGCLDLSADPSAHHRLEVMGGVRESEARRQLEGWFRGRRAELRRRRQPPGPKDGRPEARWRTD